MNRQSESSWADGPACPVPLNEHAAVLLAHGSGGRMMHQLLESLVLPAFSMAVGVGAPDAAVLDLGSARLAFTTDSYVVRPLFFPGGDIGKLAVNGTVNDLAMIGARPLFLSTALILEEGLDMETLRRVLHSMRQAADTAGVSVVTGDTKVVERGAADGMFINTAGIGVIEHQRRIAPESVRPGDVVLLSGDIGRHGVAVMVARESLGFEGSIESDSCSVAALVQELLIAGIGIHCMRDLTRGGLASALVEIARAVGVQIEIEEPAIPVQPGVRAVCEILGLDPIYVANEGRFAAFVAPESANAALAIMRNHPFGLEAAVIGRVTDRNPGLVTMESSIGVPRVVEMLSGDQLPRIC